MTIDKDLYLISAAVVLKVQGAHARSAWLDNRFPTANYQVIGLGCGPGICMHSRWFWIGCKPTEPKLLSVDSKATPGAGCYTSCIISQHYLPSTLFKQADVFGVPCGSLTLSYPRALPNAVHNCCLGAWVRQKQNWAINPWLVQLTIISRGIVTTYWMPMMSHTLYHELYTPHSILIRAPMNYILLSASYRKRHRCSKR